MTFIVIILAKQVYIFLETPKQSNRYVLVAAAKHRYTKMNSTDKLYIPRTNQVIEAIARHLNVQTVGQNVYSYRHGTDSLFLDTIVLYASGH